MGGLVCSRRVLAQVRQKSHTRGAPCIVSQPLPCLVVRVIEQPFFKQPLDIIFLPQLVATLAGNAKPVVLCASVGARPAVPCSRMGIQFGAGAAGDLRLYGGGQAGREAVEWLPRAVEPWFVMRRRGDEHSD